MLPSLLAKIETSAGLTPEGYTAAANAVPDDASGRDNLQSTAARVAIGSPNAKPPMTTQQFGQWIAVAVAVGFAAWLFTHD